MTSKLLKELKEVNFSCTSPASASASASASIDASSMNQQSMLMSARIGGRAIDRCSLHLRDPLRAKSLNPLLSQSQPPNSKPKNFSSSNNKRASEKKPIELFSPASSRRYLLSGESSSNDFLEPEQYASSSSSVTVNEVSRFQSPKVEESVLMMPFETSWNETLKVEGAYDSKPSSSSSTAATLVSAEPQELQVVVLRVSLHCKGCEGKVRKHISKMEGVKSFTTDLVNKKVTVVGDVTPLGVLNSISKVKNAQLWPSQPPASASF